jgi:hypothetical protein
MNPWIVVLAIGDLLLVVAVAVIGAALVEVFRQLREFRTTLALDDLPLPLDLRGAKILSTDFGLASAMVSLPEAVIVVLSTKCATCLAIAQSFAGGAPNSVWFVLQTTEDDAASMRAVLNSCRERLVVDRDGRMCERVGLQVTPSVLTVRWGEVVRAQAVSSVRQVFSLVPVVSPIGARTVSDGEDAVTESGSRGFVELRDD